MKTTRIKHIISFVILIMTGGTLLTGCQDDFLVQTNPNAPSTDTFWETVEDLNFGLTGAYRNFSSAQNIRMIDEMSRSDLDWASGFRRPNNSNPYYLQIFTDADQTPNNKWHQNYKTIFSANQVIDACNNLIGTLPSEEQEEKAKLILAQATFLRGYMYFILYNSFNGGAVPIHDKAATDEKDLAQPIQPAAKVKDFYLKDLQYASENLPISWDNASDKGRFTAGAAVALMAQTSMYEGDFGTAADSFKKVIDNYGYSLTIDVGSNFTTRDELNEESIIEAIYSTDYKNNLGQWDPRDVANTAYHKKLTAINGWWGAVTANWLILEYRNDPMDLSDDRNKRADGSFRRFSLRTSQSVALVDDIDTPYYGEDNPGRAANFNVRMTCFWRKHTNWDLGAKDEDVLSPGKVRSGVNARLLRLAEIYLQYAECQIELGDVDEALKYINRVRRRSALQLLGPNGSGEYPTNDHDNNPYTAATLMDHLRYKEYPLELSCEGDGDRNIDLRRWGQYGNHIRVNNKLERFKELAAKKYGEDHFEVTKEDGSKVTRWGSIVKELPVGDPGIKSYWDEFQQAALNYNDTKAYWPIPNSEIISNPNLYDIVPAQ